MSKEDFTAILAYLDMTPAVFITMHGILLVAIVAYLIVAIKAFIYLFSIRKERRKHDWKK